MAWRVFCVLVSLSALVFIFSITYPVIGLPRPYSVAGIGFWLSIAGIVGVMFLPGPKKGSEDGRADHKS